MEVTERPLHEQVALALGRCIDHTFEDLRPEEWAARCRKCGLTEGMGPGQKAVLTMDEAPHYDTDWRVTGPLIERYGLTIGQGTESHVWVARDEPQRTEKGEGPDPLIAVCLLLLALKAADKLGV